MQNTPTELYRDALAQIAADRLSHDTIKQANLIADNAADFNIAVWASIRLFEITRLP